jgi:hypothetical protein
VCRLPVARVRAAILKPEECHLPTNLLVRTTAPDALRRAAKPPGSLVHHAFFSRSVHSNAQSQDPHRRPSPCRIPNKSLPLRHNWLRSANCRANWMHKTGRPETFGPIFRLAASGRHGSSFFQPSPGTTIRPPPPHRSVFIRVHLWPQCFPEIVHSFAQIGSLSQKAPGASAERPAQPLAGRSAT